MNEEIMRNWLLQNKYTAYEISKQTNLSLQGAADFLEGNRKPRRKTLKEVEDFIENKKELKKENVVSEPQTVYRNVSNEDIYKLIESLGISLGNNAKVVADVLGSTYDNTKKILKDTEVIKWNTINKASNDLEKKNT